MPETIEGVSHVSAAELAEIWNDPEQRNIYIIDVREPEEYQEAHIPGIPLLPMGEIPELIDQFDKEAEYILVCRSGRRSLEVSKYFQSEGIQQVHNYAGGMLAWEADVVDGLEHVITSFSMKNLERKLAK